RRLVEFEDLAASVGDDDGLKDGAHHGVDELKLHLTASGFGLAQVTEPNSQAIEFSGNGAEVVAGTPFHSLMEVSLADAACYARGMAQRNDDQHQHDGRDR